MAKATSGLTSILRTLTAACLLCAAACAHQKTARMSDIASPAASPGWVVFKPDVRIPAKDIFRLYPKAFHLADGTDMKVLSSETDELGFQHFRYQQYFKSIKVEGAEFTVHAKDGIALKANGHLATDFAPAATAARLSESDARTIAKELVQSPRYYNEATMAEDLVRPVASVPDYEPVGELVFRRRSDANQSYDLAWTFKLYTADLRSSRQVYVNASSGAILVVLPLFHNCATGSGNTTFRSNQRFNTRNSNGAFSLVDDCNGNFLTARQKNTTNKTLSVLTDADNDWNDSSRSDVTSFWALVVSYDYFRLVHDRMSYDGWNGNMAITNDFEEKNASGGNGLISIGLGTAGDADDYNTTDIVGHEFTHSVTQKSAGLESSPDSESGALSESFSDIFGIATQRWEERLLKLPTPSWTIGAQRGCPICRDLKDPNKTQNPAYYKGSMWNTSDPHINTGVQNRWFYLLTDGATGTNEKGQKFSVQGIGLAKAEKIAYRTLTRYLGKQSTFDDARQGSIEAAVDLFGTSSVEVGETIKAWCAVGLCGYTVPTRADIYDRPGGNLNPSSPNNNDTLQGATRLPTFMVGKSGSAASLKVSGMNIYPFEDVDYYRIPAALFNVPSGLGACSRLVLSINVTANVDAQVFSDDRLVGTFRDIAYTRLPSVNRDNAVIAITPVFPGQLMEYDLTISAQIGFDQQCVPRLDPKTRLELLQDCISCRSYIINAMEELVINPAYLSVGDNPDTKYLLYWNGKGPLTIDVGVEAGNKVKLDLFSPDGKLLATGSNVPSNGSFARQFSVRTGDLPEGFYVATFSEFANDTRLRIALPESVRLKNLQRVQ